MKNDFEREFDVTHAKGIDVLCYTVGVTLSSIPPYNMQSMECLYLRYYFLLFYRLKALYFDLERRSIESLSAEFGK